MDRDFPVESSAPHEDFDPLSRQHSLFALLNLFLLVALWIGHTSFSGFWGKPSRPLLMLLTAAFAVRAGELLWLRRFDMRPEISPAWTCCSIAFNLALAVVLASVVDREDSQYAALLVVPVLESAYRFGLTATVAVAAVADGIVFYWVWRYFYLHPPPKIGEYFEAGTLSIIFMIVAVLGFFIVRRLRRRQTLLERTRESLLQQEKMAAVGRLSSALSHEIRNPVAMISSSLATALSLEGEEREQMLEIARMESARLVGLTNDLLAYVRPRRPSPSPGDLGDTVRYVADACRAHAATRDVAIEVHAPASAPAEYDPGLLQQVLMNLVMNAVDASPPGAAVSLAVACVGSQKRIDIENTGGPIPDEVEKRLFEPFFTTKSQGTGLGLATAYSLMRAQGGDLVLLSNSRAVRFSALLPLTARTR